MFVLKSTMEAQANELRRQLSVERENKRRMAESMDSENRHLRRQLAEAKAELATFRAKRAKANANLIPGGAKAKARVMQARKEAV